LPCGATMCWAAFKFNRRAEKWVNPDQIPPNPETLSRLPWWVWPWVPKAVSWPVVPPNPPTTPTVSGAPG